MEEGKNNELLKLNKKSLKDIQIITTIENQKKISSQKKYQNKMLIKQL